MYRFSRNELRSRAPLVISNIDSCITSSPSIGDSRILDAGCMLALLHDAVTEYLSSISTDSNMPINRCFLDCSRLIHMPFPLFHYFRVNFSLRKAIAGYCLHNIQGILKFAHLEYRTWYFMLKQTIFSFYKIASDKFSSFCRRTDWSYTSKRKNCTHKKKVPCAGDLVMYFT